MHQIIYNTDYNLFLYRFTLSEVKLHQRTQRIVILALCRQNLPSQPQTVLSFLDFLDHHILLFDIAIDPIQSLANDRPPAFNLFHHQKDIVLPLREIRHKFLTHLFLQ